MSCDLCGAGGSTTLVRIESVPFHVCANCARYGQEIRVAKPRAIRPKTNDTAIVRTDAGKILRQARERRGLRMDEFAKLLQVKESELHSWETGQRLMTVELARRIEKRAGVVLVTEESSGEAVSAYRPPTSGSMTIGDMFSKK